MATKQFLDLNGLSQYHNLITEYIGTEDAKSIKSISVSGNTVSFFKTADGSGTAAYTVNLPDVSGFMDKIANASGDKVVMSNSDGSVSESEIDVNNLALTDGTLESGYFVGFDGSMLTRGGSTELILYRNAIDWSGDGYILVNNYNDASKSAVNIDDVMLKIASATGDKMLVSNANGEAVESYGITDGSDTDIGFITGYFSQPPSESDVMVWNKAIGGITSKGVSINDLATTTDLADKMDKIDSASGGKIATTTATGEVAESNTSISDLTTAIADKIDKIADATGGKIATTTASGEVAESGVAIADLAQIGASGFTTGYIVTVDSNGKLQATTDPKHIMNSMSGATGGKIVTSTNNGQVAESNTAISDLATQTDLADKMDKIAGAQGGQVLVSNANGEAVESDYVIGAINHTGIVTGYLQGESGRIIVQGGSLGDIYSSKLDIDDIATTTDLADKIDKISNATGGKIATTTATGEVAESNTSISDLTTAIGGKVAKIANATGDKIVVSTSSGEVTESFDTDYIAGIAPDCGYYITYYAGRHDGYNELQVVEGVSSDDLINIKAATAGFDGDNTIADFIGTIPQGSSATDVIGYIDEVAGDVGDEMKVTLVKAQTPTTGYLKTYELYQGGNAAANLVGKIDIPKDLVVTSGEIVVNPTGQPAGTYLKLTIANQTTPVYINVADLCDVYTAASGATQVQLAISATNEISATLVAGGVGTTELAANAVTTQKIANDAVTADKVAISAHTEAQTAGAGNGGLNLSITTTDGQVSAVSGSIAANTYDAYGAASTVQSTVIGTAGDAASANTINGAKAYADAVTAAIATADIQALFA